MDVKLVNPFINAFTAVLPQMGFPTPERTGMSVKEKTINSLGITVLVGFTKEIRGNVCYNMSEDTAKFIASTMMMGMPVETFDEMAQSAISEMSNMLTATAATNLTALRSSPRSSVESAETLSLEVSFTPLPHAQTAPSVR